MNVELPQPRQQGSDTLHARCPANRSPGAALDCSPSTLPELPLGLVELALHNRLHMRRQPWQGEVMGQALMVCWANGEASDATGEDHLQLLCALGQGRLVLGLPLSIAQQLGGIALSHSASRPAAVNLWEPGLPAEGPEYATQAPAQTPAIHNPVDLATSLLIEHAWLPLIESLEALFQQPLRVLPGAAFEAPLQLELSLQLNDQPALSASLRMDTHSAAQVLDVLDRCCPRAPLAFDWLPLAAQLNAGDAPLTVAEWQSLQPGDVVMLDQPADALPSLVIGGRLQAAVQVDGSRVCLRQALFPLYRNHPMSTTEALDGALDSLPLTLTCQLGSYELSLAQLREMGPGSVLPLATDNERVELMINGRRVGQGELVRIGSGLGVRLLSLANP